jgi:hypothetical protein
LKTGLRLAALLKFDHRPRPRFHLQFFMDRMQMRPDGEVSRAGSILNGA